MRPPLTVHWGDAMMGAMKPVKRSVAVVVGRPGGAAPGGEFLVVRRPDDPDDPLPALWGLPAVPCSTARTSGPAAVRAGRVKLGVELAPGARIGEKTADRGGYLLRLADYEATVLDGVPGPAAGRLDDPVHRVPLHQPIRRPWPRRRRAAPSALRSSSKITARSGWPLGVRGART